MRIITILMARDEQGEPTALEESDVCAFGKNLRDQGIRVIVCANLEEYAQCIIVMRSCTSKEITAAVPEHLHIIFQTADLDTTPDLQEFFRKLFLIQGGTHGT